MTAKPCCGTSVGVLVFSADRSEMLLSQRNTPPPGIAAAACGHGDLDTEHPTIEDAARGETHEEIGLQATGLTRLGLGGFHPGRCRRPGSAGHHWYLFEATVTGTLAPSPREVAAVGWWSLADLQHLAERTADHAAGLISAAAFAASPGLEPVWVHWMSELGHIDLPGQDLDAIRDLATTPPTTG